MLSKSAKFVSGALLSLSLLTSGCAVPLFTLFDNDDGTVLAAGESSTVHFFTSLPNFDTGVNLGAGNTYDLNIAILSQWNDAHIELDESGNKISERGFANSEMPFEALGVTRRSREHRWFELMLYQPNCGRESLRGVTELNSDEESGAYRFVATCDGNLRLFVNDSPGFYLNNLGYANITLSRVN
ncbi:MAG: hypothetical protein MI746_00360 [Pseudomonadales bacterium]|nr:hypothetical protein [Pseudomonadales bacterium]